MDLITPVLKGVLRKILASQTDHISKDHSIVGGGYCMSSQGIMGST
jgi:hypothetical protein